ncbi:MAG: amine oxidase, partial [Actinobacteria bacterium]|nr:amine oxidase [Actinomycetota bacterium]
LERGLYFAALVLTALAGVCLIAPSVHHRIQFRLQAKEDVVRIGNSLAISGLALIALAMNCVLLLVIDYLFGLVPAVVTAVGVAAIFGGVWYLIPLLGRRSRRRPPGHFLQAK